MNNSQSPPFMKKFIISGLVLVAAVVVGKFWLDLAKERQPSENILRITIPEGATISKLLQEADLGTSTISAILDNTKEVYDLAKIVSGRELVLTLANVDGTFKGLVYKIDTEKQLVVVRPELESDAAGATEPILRAGVVPIPYAVKEEKIEGVIQGSLYEAFLENELDVRLALALAEIFAWQIDFAADIRAGDNFKVFYEKRFLGGEYVMPGKILAAEFINAGESFRGYYFQSENTKANYYDEEGNSLQKQFLKSPLQYKYISSGFSYARYNPITKEVSPHRGIDYAANAGTPAVSVGDGAIIQAGWNGYYGLSVTVRHNETYKTRYGHFSSLARGISVGKKVKQGQVVGYVGSTGLATGPHLHYEMHKFNNYVNPFKVEIPPGEPIAEIDQEVFGAAKERYKF